MEKIDLGNGQTLNIPDDISIEDRRLLAAQIQSRYGVDINQTTVLGQLAEIPKGFVRGISNIAVDIPLGISSLLDVGNDGRVTKGLQELKEYIREDSILAPEAGYEDTFVTKLSEGFGSFVPFLGAGVAGRALASRGAVSPLTGAYGLPASLAVPTGVSQQADRIGMARQLGEDVSPFAETTAELFGGAIGITEILPVANILRKIDKTALKDDVLRARIMSALQSGAVEGGQEVFASLLQDVTARGLYSDELPIGESILDEFTIGGIVGATADFVLNSMTGKRGIGNTHHYKKEKKLREQSSALQESYKLDKAREQGEVTEFQEPTANVVPPQVPVPFAEVQEQQMEVMQTSKDLEQGTYSIVNPVNGSVLQEGLPSRADALKYIEMNKDEVSLKQTKAQIENILYLQGLINSSTGFELGNITLNPNSTTIEMMTALNYDSSFLKLEQKLADPALSKEQKDKILKKFNETKDNKYTELNYSFAELKDILPKKDFNLLLDDLSNVVFKESEAKGINSIRNDKSKVNASLDYIKEFAASKNIDLDFSDPAVKYFAKQVTGYETINSRTPVSARKLFLARLHSLPSFNFKTRFPDFRPRTYSALDMANFVANAKDVEFTIQDLKNSNLGRGADAEAVVDSNIANQFLNDLLVSGRAEKISGTNKYKLVNNFEFEIARKAEGFVETPAEFEARLRAEGQLPEETIIKLVEAENLRQEGYLPPAEVVPKMINFRQAIEEGKTNKFAKEAKKMLDAAGLNETGVIISDELLSASSLVEMSDGTIIRDPREVEGRVSEYDKDSDIIFISLNAINPEGTASDLEIQQSIKRIIDGDLIKSIRNKDLFTEDEYQFLRKYVKRTKYPNSNATFYNQTIAENQQKISDLREAGIKEDAVEETIIEDSIANLYKNRHAKVKVAPKAESILGKISNMFDALGKAVQRSGMNRASEIFTAIEQGKVGTRTRDQIRTLRELDRLPLGAETAPVFEIDESDEATSIAEDAADILTGDAGIEPTKTPYGDLGTRIRGITIADKDRTQPIDPKKFDNKKARYNFDKLSAAEKEADAKILIDNLQDKDVSGVAEWLSLNGPDKGYRAIAKRINKQLEQIKKLGFSFDFIIVNSKQDIPEYANTRERNNLLGGKTVGMLASNPDAVESDLDFKKFTLYINNTFGVDPDPGGLNYNTILHELVHAVTISNVNAIEIGLDVLTNFRLVPGEITANIREGLLPSSIGRGLNAMDLKFQGQFLDPKVAGAPDNLIYDNEMQSFSDNVIAEANVQLDILFNGDKAKIFSKRKDILYEKYDHLEGRNYQERMIGLLAINNRQFNPDYKDIKTREGLTERSKRHYDNAKFLTKRQYDNYLKLQKIRNAMGKDMMEKSKLVKESDDYKSFLASDPDLSTSDKRREHARLLELQHGIGFYAAYATNTLDRSNDIPLNLNDNNANSIHELLTVGLTDVNVQNYMKTIPSIFKTDKNLWTSFVKSLREMINIPNSESSLFTDFIEEASASLEVPRSDLRLMENYMDDRTLPGAATEEQVYAQVREPDKSLSQQVDATALLDFIKQNPGGFTVDPITLESPTSGFAVSPIKALELVLDPNEITTADAIQFYENVADLAQEIDQPVFAGGWLNPDNGKYYLDATIVFDKKEDALYTADIPTLNREGKLEKQEAIFDLGTFNETKTEQGIQELRNSGRFSSEARRRQEERITKLSKLFEESRNQTKELRQPDKSLTLDEQISRAEQQLYTAERILSVDGSTVTSRTIKKLYGDVARAQGILDNLLARKAKETKLTTERNTFDLSKRYADESTGTTKIKLERATEKAEELAKSTPNGQIPTYNTNASDVALEAAFEFNEDTSKPKGMPEVSETKKPPDAKDDPAIPEEYRDSINDLGYVPSEETNFGKRIIRFISNPFTSFKKMFTNFRQDIIDRYDKIEQTIINGSLENEAVRIANNIVTTSTMAAIRMADRAKGIFQGMLTRGYVDNLIEGEDALTHTKPLEIKAQYNPFLKPEEQDTRDASGNIIKEKGKTYGGLVQIFAPLYADPAINREAIWSLYAKIKRIKELNETGQRLLKSGQEFTKAERDKIDAKYFSIPFTPKMQEQINSIESKHKSVVEVYENYQNWNNKLITFAEEKGLLDAEQAELWRQQSSYYPFYRQMADESIGGPRVAAGALPTNPLNIDLKGSDAPIDVNPIEAIAKNSLSILTAAMKNDGATKLARDLVSLGKAKELTPKEIEESKGKINTIFTFENGNKKYFKLEDPELFLSIQAIGGQNTEFIPKLLAIPSSFLRDAVTRDPGFVVVNILRDTLSSAVTSGAPLGVGDDGFTPIIDSFRNMGRDMGDLEKFGIIGGYDFQNDEGSVKDFINRAMRKEGLTPDNGISPSSAFIKLWDGLGALTTKSDGATRLAVHDSVYQDLKKRGASEAVAQSEAAFQGLEIINFGRRGLAAHMRIITAGIPFFNARIQGLDVLFRSFTGKYSAIEKLQEGQTAKELKSKIMTNAILRGGLLVGITMMYYALMHDTDEYKGLSREVRDDNWIIPLPGDIPALKIPIPFEVGMLFKAIPERLLDEATGALTQGERGGVEGNVLESIGRQVTTSTAIPFFQPGMGFQLLKPIGEVLANKNTYTGTEIVPYYQLNLEKELQSRPSTNEFVRLLSEAFNVSPIQLEHILRGYGGTLGTYVLQLADVTARSVTGTPLMPTNLNSIPVIKRLFIDLDKSGGGLQQQFYELRSEVDTMVQTMNKLRADGRFDELSAYRSNMQGLLNIKGQIRSMDRYMANWRKRRDSLLRRTDISSAVKEDLLNQMELDRDRRLAMISLLRKRADIPMDIPFFGRI